MFRWFFVFAFLAGMAPAMDLHKLSETEELCARPLVAGQDPTLRLADLGWERIPAEKVGQAETDALAVMLLSANLLWEKWPETRKIAAESHTDETNLQRRFYTRNGGQELLYTVYVTPKDLGNGMPQLHSLICRTALSGTSAHARDILATYDAPAAPAAEVDRFSADIGTSSVEVAYFLLDAAAISAEIGTPFPYSVTTVAYGVTLDF